VRKQLAAAIACLLVLGVGTTAYADGDNIGITITDITPREERNSETQNAYAAGGYFPLQIQTAEDEGVRLLIKTFVVPQDTPPQALIQEGLTRRGVEYQVSDILRRELEGSSESRQVSQTVTLPSETDETDKLLALLEPSISYSEDGYTGTLTLDRDSVRTEVSDTTGYSYTIQDTREYTGLARNDPYYIPKTAEKNGVTLRLADIRWTAANGGLDSQGFPTRYNAAALYTGTGYGSRAEGYLVTAAYTGEAVKTNAGDVMYSIVYEEVSPAVPDDPTGKDFPWEMLLFVSLLIAIAIGTVFAVPRVIKMGKRFWEEQRRRKRNKEPYAGREPMDLPEMLNEMDRGLEEER
jgi:hypothetical protein